MINFDLYDFQKEALEKTADLKNVLYAYEMGLGKTFIGSEKLRQLNYKKNLVICQKSKIEDWKSHFINNGYEYAVYDLTKKNELNKFLDLDIKRIGIINYDLAFRRPELLKLINFCLLLDESSLIQNEKTKRFKFVNKLRFSACIMLSGTVINGNYEKLWSQCKLLGWHISKTEFYRNFVVTRPYETNGFTIRLVCGYKNVKRLKHILKEYGAVFKKSIDCLDLPDRQMIFKDVKPPAEYKKFCKDKIIEIEGKLLNGDYKMNERLCKKYILGAFNKYRLKAFKDLIDSTNDRVIVFYNYNLELEKLKAQVKERHISVVNGNEFNLTNYNNYDDTVTFIQYQAGSMGLNLQMSNKIIYFTMPEGNSEMFEQSKKRIHRIGQKKKCFYYVLKTNTDFENDIWIKLQNKDRRTKFLWR